MRLWLSKNSEVSLREQLTRQIMLAILSGDLPAGAKLPSVRELALRHRIHQNTVSAAYRQLQMENLIEARKGSGVFVREIGETQRREIFENSVSELDRLIFRFLQNAQQKGFSENQIKSRLAEFFKRPALEKIILVEENAELRRIIAGEISAELDFPLIETNCENFWQHLTDENSIFIAFPETAKKVQSLLPPQAIFLRLKANSVQEELRGKSRPANDELIGLISHWQMFRDWSKLILIAAGIDDESIIVRDAGAKDALKGLSQCSFIIADSFTAQSLTEYKDVRVFPIVSKESIEDLRIKIGRPI